MLRNVTFTAEESLIARARARARRRRTTLNAEFREWLLRYADQEGRGKAYRALMENLAHVKAGRKFSRDELNER